jgi:hypothetical protein
MGLGNTYLPLFFLFFFKNTIFNLRLREKQAISTTPNEYDHPNPESETLQSDHVAMRVKLD